VGEGKGEGNMAQQPPLLTERARAMRRQPTEAERKLWVALRSGALAGHRFRRQHPIPPFVVDLACPPATLVVELDGGQHAASRSDPARQRALEERGWRVLRFWNNEVLANLEGVLTVILAAVSEQPSPSPSPIGRRERGLQQRRETSEAGPGVAAKKRETPSWSPRPPTGGRGCG
jgi:very-short-patch-repair endonuclease